MQYSTQLQNVIERSPIKEAFQSQVTRKNYCGREDKIIKEVTNLISNSILMNELLLQKINVFKKINVIYKTLLNAPQLTRLFKAK